MVFDFTKFEQPSNSKKPENPIDIFNSSPSIPGKPNDLWQGQSKALEQWYELKDKNDVLVSLHTGAGKSLVGGLIAQSLVNSGKEKVLFACATNDLVKQTSQELTQMLSLKHSTRIGGSYSNELYEIGKGFCITNYQAVFNSYTTFRGDNTPEAIIFDDAHVSEKIIRDCYTLTINRRKREQLFLSLVKLVKPYFETINKGQYFVDILNNNSIYKVIAAPPRAVAELAKSWALRDLFNEHQLMSQQSMERFSYAHLSDNLGHCSIFFSPSSIEITPTFLPSKKMPFLADRSIKRVYLSATLSSEVDFCRAFGRKPKFTVSPSSDAGVGERLILFVEKDKLKAISGMPVKDSTLATIISEQQKLLIATANYRTAEKYANLATPPKTSEFSEKLDLFRKQKDNSGAFILVARVDGIDLPKDTCRVTFADSLPFGFSLSERYQFDFLNMHVSLASKLATRITQLFGRTNRGRNDYSIIFVTDNKFINWLKRDRNLSLLPELLQRQVSLGASLTNQMAIDDTGKYVGLMNQVLQRDEGWLNFYAAHIHGQDLDEDAQLQAKDDDEIMTRAALAEADYASAIWEGDFSGARDALIDVIDDVSTSDRKLAGWYNVQIGHTFDLGGDHDSAAKQYRIAKGRISQSLCLPTLVQTNSIFSAVESHNPFHSKLVEIFGNDMSQQVPLLHKYKFQIKKLFDKSESTNNHEEALRAFGELLGFSASRPEKEDSENSTLDVLWSCEDTKSSILFTLKTKKKATNSINSEEVGQAHNHEQWFNTYKNDLTPLGTIFVTDNETVTENASPSDLMYSVTPDRIKSLFDELIASLLMISSKTPLERIAEIEILSSRPEWKLNGLFKSMGPKKLG